jgi:hypothetical protein
MVSLKADLSEIIGVVHSISDFRATISYTVSGTLGGIAIANQANLAPTTQKMAT